MPASPTPSRPARLWARATATTATLAVSATAALVLVEGPGPDRRTASADPGAAPGLAGPVSTAVLRPVAARKTRWPGHPDRRLVRYTVRRGDTATGLAVRYHAWTAELRALNHLGRSGRLVAGERITIPVVVSATRRAHRHHARHHQTRHHQTRHHQTRRTYPWRHASASRATVRGAVVRTARRHRVKPALALAIAWQESGWQQRRVSSAGAIGVMQVMPATGRWVSGYEGRRLNLYGLYDNLTAGMRVIRLLKSMADGQRVIGAYYQGLGSIRRHGMYPSTRAYVRSVVHLRDRLRAGRGPS